MKKRDIVLIAAALLAAGVLYALSHLALGGQATTVVVTIDGKEALRAPLAANDTYTLEQEDGSVNVLEVASGSVRMIEANCRDGLCVKQGATRSAAKSIVCLPHNLVVRLESGDAQPDDGLDVII